jgi:hypothetical protein
VEGLCVMWSAFAVGHKSRNWVACEFYLFDDDWTLGLQVYGRLRDVTFAYQLGW